MKRTLAHNTARRFFLLVLSCLFGMGITVTNGQEPQQEQSRRPLFSSTAFAIGRATLHDSYLSINKYQGIELGLMHERMRVLPYGNGKWVMRHRIDASAANAFSPSGNGHIISAMLDYTHSQLYTLRFPCGIILRTGGEAGLSGGVLYNPRNSNNPASAKAVFTLGIAEMLTYTAHIGNYPITLRYSLSMPIIGIFFNPAFGESYYEIFYLGNHRGIVKFGSWQNRFDMNNLLTLDLPIRRCALRIGYDNIIRTCRANDLHYSHYSNAFLIGVSTPIQLRKKSVGTTLPAFY
ncbi:MAG: DUF3316 domain-containing protein [Porphyromonadaceae bacterium]|nr:DUF3316 domain-containing protein [Porphyromonadaceae bacterium]